MLDAQQEVHVLGGILPSIAPAVDYAKETRVFLYFPNGATKATAVFVAVNSDLKPPLNTMQRSAGGHMATYNFQAGLETGLVTDAWVFQHETWREVILLSQTVLRKWSDYRLYSIFAEKPSERCTTQGSGSWTRPCL